MLSFSGKYEKRDQACHNQTLFTTNDALKGVIFEIALPIPRVLLEQSIQSTFTEAGVFLSVLKPRSFKQLHQYLQTCQSMIVK